MDILQQLFDNAPVIAAALVSMVMALATIITIFIDESKVNKFVKPIVSVLNLIAGNIGKNKNKTDAE